MRPFFMVYLLTACSTANVFSASNADKDHSENPSTQPPTTTSTEQEHADIPTWINGSYLTCAWGDLRLDEQLDVHCGLVSSHQGAPPMSLAMNCQTVSVAQNQALPSLITQKDPLNVSIILAGNLIRSTKLQCDLLNGSVPESTNKLEVIFSQTLLELENQIFVECVTTPPQDGTKACFESLENNTPTQKGHCGTDATDNCYSGGRAAAAIAAGGATTPSGKTLTYNRSTSIWEESNGTRVLASDGSDRWAMQLTADGRSYSDKFLDKAHAAGRVCPTGVFTPGNLITTGNCLYYDAGNPGQRLDGPQNDENTDQTTPGNYRLASWAAAATGNGMSGSWYEGNIATCAGKGMRLPTLFETNASGAGQSFLPDDATPQWLANGATGVPSVGSSLTWTASAFTNPAFFPSAYWIWSGQGTNNTSIQYPQAVRCVIP